MSTKISNNKSQIKLFKFTHFFQIQTRCKGRTKEKESKQIDKKIWQNQ